MWPPIVAAPVDEEGAGRQVIILRPQNPLPVIPREQEGFYSCWATAAEMIMDFLGNHVRQCEQASRPTDVQCWCCDNQRRLLTHPDCDAPDYPDFERWGFHCKLQAPTALTWNEVTREIDEGRPFAFSWTPADPSTQGGQISHMLVVVGYNQPGGPETRMLFCLNPRPFAVADEMAVFYSEYNSNDGPTGAAATPSAHIHQSDYFDIRPAPAGSTTP